MRGGWNVADDTIFVDARERPAPPEITRDDIFNSDDVAGLQDWYDRVTETADYVGARISSLRDAGIVDDEMHRACKKLTHLRIAMQWIKRRLDQLDAPLSNRKEHTQQRVIARLENEVRNLRARIAELRG